MENKKHTTIHVRLSIVEANALLSTVEYGIDCLEKNNTEQGNDIMSGDTKRALGKIARAISSKLKGNLEQHNKE